jgi:hypothetical protein
LDINAGFSNENIHFGVDTIFALWRGMHQQSTASLGKPLRSANAAVQLWASLREEALQHNAKFF